MFDFKGHRRFWLAAAAAGLLTLGGCSNQGTEQATNQKLAAAPAKKAGGSKAVPAKSSAKKVQSSKVVTVPKGTSIRATVGQTLASNKSHAGDSFTASVSAPVKVGGKTVIPKGAHVTGRVVTAKKKRPAQLTVELASVEIRGVSYPLETNPIGQSSDSLAKDGAATKGKKDITLPAESQLKFKLAKPVKIPLNG
ncbi:MAG TPA: hypothetical protein VEU31_06675 [Candidatus Acidoferrales bacterium]|nr:hypothetical protein [Candidatus Acidoferrales bacterium]